MASIEKLEARLDGIGHLLGDRYIEVPPYQRAYSWTDEQVEDLFKDFSDAIRERNTEYFLGTIVLTTNKDGPHAVIDGQQRLATTSILICAIRNYFYSIDDGERGDTLHAEFLARKDRRDLTEIPHLKLMPGDNSYYERAILAKPASGPKTAGGVAVQKALPPSQARLEAAIKIATRYVQILVDQTKEPTKVLMDWIDFLEKKGKVIVVEVNDEAAAYTIFEVLNDRGLDLSVADLLKNYLFRMAEDRVTETQQNWTSMASRLESVGAEEKELRNFIRHVWASEYGLTREKDLYDAICKRVDSKQRAVAFADGLNKAAPIYMALDNPSDELWKQYGPQVRESVEALQILKAIQIRPLVLAILRQFEVAEVRKTLPMLVCWTVRFMITGKLGSGPLEVGYSDRAKDVSSGIIKTSKQLYDASKGFLVTDADFEQAFANARISQHYLARFYLRVLEKQSGAKGEGELVVNPNEDAVNLEHIMPQTRDPYWTADVTAEQHAALVKRLGNLALLDKALNGKSGNLAFVDKISTLKESKIALTKQIASYQKWTAAEIDARQKMLAELAVQAWPSPPR